MLRLNSHPFHHETFGYHPDDNWLIPTHHHYQPLFADREPFVVNDAEKFAVRMDVAQYTPEEIDVKVVEHDERDLSSPSTLIITGKHEEDHTDDQSDESHRTIKQQHVSRSFTRRYSLPPDVDEKHLTCALNERGVLTVNAPRVQLPALADSSKVRAISIAVEEHKDDHNSKLKSLLHKVFHHNHH